MSKASSGFHARSARTAAAGKAGLSSPPAKPSRFALAVPKAGQTVPIGPNPGELHPFQHPAGDATMALGDFLPAKNIAAITRIGAISFHALGDSGVGGIQQQAIADAMSRDIDVNNPDHSPAFLLHLGDIIYGNQKIAGYANRFYRPNENYHNYIFGIPGNHDGEVRLAADAPSLSAFLENFCQPPGHQPAMAQTFGRTVPNQPGAYWRLNCPFVDIVGLYSNSGENYGTISHPDIQDNGQQKDWLAATLTKIKSDRGGNLKALLIVVHHPPFSSGLQTSTFAHPGNPDLLADIDACCAQAGLWPDAVLAAHSHNYQRYMRTLKVGAKTRITPYLVVGTGGISTQNVVTPIGVTASAPDGTVQYANALQSFGFLTATATATTLTLTFTSAVGTHRSLFETVTVDLATGVAT